MDAVETPLLVDVLSPTAVVEAGKWVGANGNKVAQAGIRAHGVALAEFSAKDVTAATAIPPKKLAVARLGFAEVKLGGTVGDNVFGTCDANGDTIAAAAGQERLCFVPKGGAAGDFRRVLILGNFASAEPSAAIVDLTAATGTGDNTVVDVGAAFNQATLNDNFKDLATKVNAILSVLRARGDIAL